MLDSGSSVSLVRKDILDKAKFTRVKPRQGIQLTTAAGQVL